MATDRILFDHPMSGNCQKVHVLLRALDLPYTTRRIDLEGGEQHQDWFRALNALGQVPVLKDGAAVISDSQAILLYLAQAYDPSWIDPTPAGMADIQGWLSYAAREVSLGPQMTRLYHLTGRSEVDIASSERMSLEVLRHLDAHLRAREWLALERPTIADLAVFPYIALARDGKLDLDAHPHILRWLARIRSLPGYQPLILDPRYAPLIQHRRHAYKINTSANTASSRGP